MTKEAVNYSQTVLLPKTPFPMRGDLPKREPGMLEFWNKSGIYSKMLANRKNSKRYILHDGPPYANGHTHIGHALNKILKDIVVKSRCMSGYYTPYIPGWDCHGLPIEQALLKELKLSKRHIDDIPAFRLKAREFAAKFIDIQRSEFIRLGVFGKWDDPYLTMSPQYEGSIIEAFLELYRKGYIYRGKKTIYWCVTCETALADAETEYKDKVSSSIYVKFRLDNPPAEISGPAKSGTVSIVIWTTTPWTLPSNMAAAVSEEEDYSLLRDKKSGEHYIVASKLASNFMSECSVECDTVATLPGKKLVGLKYTHPLNGRLNPVISTDFVAMDTGVGIVHIAPGHGEDDFHAGLRWGLDIFCPVDEAGRFTKDAGEFAGMNVFEANPKVIEKLRAENKLLAAKEITHSYPHCWRCKQPIIFRATEQWFMGVDKHNLRNKLQSEIDRVKWVPKAGHERIGSMVKQRPDWCLSRQRSWGTPVPIIYCAECSEPQNDEKLFRTITDKAHKEGSDFWFRETAEQLVPAGYKCKCGSSKFRKETDILDVWMDSGVSWFAVLKAREEKEGKLYPADLYLEGSDQHRGWFQTSLIPSTALEGRAPFDAVLTHGFVLDENGKAMHKSMGNVVSPQEITSKYGAEVLRLWVALCDYSDDVRLSQKIIDGPVDTYRKFRNTIRYLLGNLWDYDPKQHAVADKDLMEMDRYMRQRLALMTKQVRADYDNFHFRNAIRGIADFCILDLSSFYLDALKDRLYTLGTTSHERRSAQTVLYDITLSLLKLMAPVLSFTAEEAWQEMLKTPAGKELPESVFLSDMPEVADYNPGAGVAERWDTIRQVRDTVLKSLEEARRKSLIGASLEAKITFRAADQKMRDFLKNTISLWPSIAIVSAAFVDEAAGSDSVEVIVEHADGAKCPRCWQWKTDIGTNSTYPELCARCAKTLETEK